ncbi:MAG: hypothetical protein QW524_02280 [Candidatus Woesearchaeota archaeon]
MMDFKNKKGGTTNILAIIMVLLVFFLIYLFYLPESEKEELFLANTTTKGNQTLKNVEILNIRPGLILGTPLKEYEYSIPSVGIHHTERYHEFYSNDMIFLYYNIFDRNEKIIKFDVDNEVLEDLQVSLNVLDNVNLRFFLNNKLIYIGKNDFTIDKSLLKKENTLLIRVNDEGNILKTYKARFSIKIIGKIRDSSYATQNIPFFLTSQPIFYCDIGNFEFFLDCGDEPENYLEVMINDNVLYSATPNCRKMYSFKIDCSQLRHGQNTIKYISKGGNYYISNSVVKIKTKQNLTEPIYFDIPKDIYSNLRNYTLNLSVVFVEQSNDYFKIKINGFERELKAKDTSFVINEYVREKNNYLLITSENPINIAELKIVAVKR